MCRIIAAGVLASVLALLPIACTGEEKPTAPEKPGGSKLPDISQKPSAGRKSDVAAVVKGNNEFAFDLYARLAKKEGNVVFSPYSISNALAMTYAGARGKTAEEIAKVLHFTLGQERLHPAQAELVRQLQEHGKSSDCRLDIASSLWGQRDLSFVPEFVDLLRSHYQAGLRQVDFKDDPEAARHAINGWVEEHTQKKIQNLIRPGEVNKTTLLVLANAVYFNGTWATQFAKVQTKEAPFHLTAIRKLRVPLMRVEGGFGYFHGDGVQVVALPYKGNRLHMVVILPDKTEEFAPVEKALVSGKATEWVAKLRGYMVDVSLPRFRITQEYRLEETLAQMGMPLSFGPNPDFSGMLSKRFAIERVAHKAHLDVSEYGTEAAAATAVIGVEPISPPPPSATFTADRPFLFLIQDSSTGAVLFLGRVVNPVSPREE